MLMSVVFVVFRVLEILTLIPTMGMLAWFVDQYTDANLLTPDFYLVLFIVSVIALAWCILTLFMYHRSGSAAKFIALIDVGFIGALIAGVYYMRAVQDWDCTTFGREGTYTGDIDNVGSITVINYDLDTNKTCAMTKASWVFGIINCVFFAITAFAAFRYGSHADHHRRRSKHGRRSRSSSYSRRRVYV